MLWARKRGCRGCLLEWGKGGVESGEGRFIDVDMYECYSPQT
jgi:hypothetical protein